MNSEYRMQESLTLSNQIMKTKTLTSTFSRCIATPDLGLYKHCIFDFIFPLSVKRYVKFNHVSQYTGNCIALYGNHIVTHIIWYVSL